jgi:tryptophan synthase beta subunit
LTHFGIFVGVGPEHAYLKDMGRAEYIAVTDDECLEGFKWLTQFEGIIPALESAHAVYGAVKLARTLKPDQIVVICVSGRGDKDINTVRDSRLFHELTVPNGGSIRP